MNWTKLAAIAVVILISGYFVWWIFFTPDFFHRHNMNAANRAALINFRENIRVGDSYENVLRAHWHQSSRELRLTPASPQLWTVSMPHEILSTDWVMYIEFADGKVFTIKVRTSDGPRPHDAPEDVGG